MARYVRILSIDGGGIRGIIPGQVLVSLERKLKEKTENQNARIADYFDLIAGTSTGGILTCIYLCPDGRGKPRFSAEEAVDLYLKNGTDIFDTTLWQRIRSMGGISDEKYSSDAIEKLLRDYFEDLKLSELLKPCLIPAYDIEQRCARFFTQHDAIKNDMDDFYVRDVARATSAAPTYFEVENLRSLTEVHYPSIDGGVFANNPALCAYAEVRAKFQNNPTAKDMVMLSVGTGIINKQPYTYQEAKDWGLVSWVRPLLSILMSGVSETVDYQLQQMFGTIDNPDQYLRVNSNLVDASAEMDDAQSDNLAALREDGTRIAEEFDDRLDAFADSLIQ